MHQIVSQCRLPSDLLLAWPLILESMADPFSIIAGTVGVLDVGLRLCKYLRYLNAAISGIEGDLATLIHDIETHIAVNEAIQQTFTANLSSTSENNTSKEAQVEVTSLWKHVSDGLVEIAEVLLELEALITLVVAPDGLKVTSRWGGFRKQLRRQAKQDDFQKLRQRLNDYQGLLQVLLGAIQLWYQTRTSRITGASLDHISDEVRQLSLQIKSQIGNLRLEDHSIGPALRSAAIIASSASLNKHFTIPQSVSSIFTGRSKYILELKDFFDRSSFPGRPETQRRFVIYGLGGSGKTQFSCKFAQDHRQSFWGVFWIDASSRESLLHSYNKIARIGVVDPNVAAAKHWLSSLEFPWLLIIDSADDPRLSIEDYFPEGERGHILITTRNPALSVHGTVGSQSYHFEKLDHDEANDLLLKASGTPVPWNSISQESASLITRALGFLPLALIHAGKAILNGLCTLSNYLSYYERSWTRLRCLSSKDKDESNWNVYSSYEIIFQGLEASGTEETGDAIDVLRILSFMHCEGIRINFFPKAAATPALEQAHSINEAATQPQSKSWKETISSWKIQVLLVVFGDFGDPVLPAALRSLDVHGSFDEIRLRLALKQLIQMSLVTQGHGSEIDVLSMHPLVHKWVRDRPQMKTAEQALWCQLTSTFLAQCILLPPLGGSEEDENLRRDLMPHLDHVRVEEAKINKVLASNLQARRIPRPSCACSMGRAQARQMAKFSRVYSQSGRWADAERLQSDVNDFLTKILGDDHQLTISIRLALSQSYWQQSKLNAAAELQTRVYNSCVTSLGAKDPKTLKIMTMLGITFEYQGRFSKAISLQEEALASLEEIFGRNHEETLTVLDNLGRVNWRYWRYDKAAELHLKALDGMKSLLGPHHLSTLTASENLAMTYLEQGGAHRLQTAETLLTEVRQQREKKLGKEAPYTLLAICNLARIKSARGRHQEAERDLLGALPIAERNLGRDHIGNLAGR